MNTPSAGQCLSHILWIFPQESVTSVSHLPSGGLSGNEPSIAGVLGDEIETQSHGPSMDVSSLLSATPPDAGVTAPYPGPLASVSLPNLYPEGSTDMMPFTTHSTVEESINGGHLETMPMDNEHLGALLGSAPATEPLSLTMGKPLDLAGPDLSSPQLDSKPLGVALTGSNAISYSLPEDPPIDAFNLQTSPLPVGLGHGDPMGCEGLALNRQQPSVADNSGQIEPLNMAGPQYISHPDAPGDNEQFCGPSSLPSLHLGQQHVAHCLSDLPGQLPQDDALIRDCSACGLLGTSVEGKGIPLTSTDVIELQHPLIAGGHGAPYLPSVPMQPKYYHQLLSPGMTFFPGE